MELDEEGGEEERDAERQQVQLEEQRDDHDDAQTDVDLCSATAITNTISRLMMKVKREESEAAMTRMERGK